MNTSNKVHVANSNTRSVKGTSSGGVREPSNPAHYPQLGASSSNIVLSDGRLPWTTSSSKDKLLVGSQRGAANEEQRASSPSTASPRITAGRTVQRDEAQGTSEMGDIDQLQLPVGNQQVS